MPESWRSRITRWGFNWFPAYRGTGARLTYVASDWREVRLRIPLSFGTRNYVGTIFGGSMFGALDPVYMIMLIKVLGPGCVVWNKSASIRFLRPGRETLYAKFVLDDAELEAIRSGLESSGRIERTYEVELANAAGVVHATSQQVISIRRREPAGSAPA